MDLDIVEYFKQINNILVNREQPVNIFDIAQNFNISISNARFLLNNYISTGLNALEDYIVIFSAVLIEHDNTIKSIIIPSHSESLNEILSDMDRLQDFGVYSIQKKNNQFLLNDFSVYCHENLIVDNLNLQYSKENKNNHKDSDKFNRGNIEIEQPKQNNINSNRSLQTKDTKSNTIAKPSIVKSNPSKPVTNVNNLNKNLKIKETKGTENLAKVFGNMVSVSEQGQKNDHHQTKLTNSQIQLFNNEEIVNNEEGEEYYYGGIPTSQKNIVKDDNTQPLALNPNLVNKDLEDMNNLQTNQNAVKRKANNDENFDNEISKKKKEIPPLKEENNHIEFNSNHTTLLNEDNEEGKEPRKVKKIRKVKKVKTYKNEKGYLVTIDEWEDEEYWSDEKKKPNIQPIQPQIINDTRNKKPNNKKIPASQSSLHSFFGK